MIVPRIRAPLRSKGLQLDGSEVRLNDRFALWLLCACAWGCAGSSVETAPASGTTPGTDPAAGAASAASATDRGFTPSSLRARPITTLDAHDIPRHWTRGSAHAFTWTPETSPSATVRVEASADEGLSWTRLGETDAALGRWVWEVPSEGPTRLRFRLVRSWSAPPEELSRSVVISASHARAYRFAQIAPTVAGVPPRDGAGAVVMNDRMWLIGGWNPLDTDAFPLTTSNDVWSSSDGIAWRQDKPNSFRDYDFDPAADWAGRHTAGYAVHDGKMWIVGGDTVQGDYQMDVWSSADGAHWNRVNAAATYPARVLHSTVSFGGSLLTIGGQDWDAAFFNDTWASLDGITWKERTSTTPRFSGRGVVCGSAVLGGRVWMIGGGRYDTATTPWQAFGDVWSSSDGATWEKVGDDAAPWSPRTYHNVVVHDGRMFVIGGYSPDMGNLDDVWYSDDGENWYLLPGMGLPARHAASTWSYRGALYVGFGNTEGFNADMWRLEL